MSQVGTWMQMVALPWLVLELTHSAVALGTVTALQFVPILAVVLFAGVVIDRLPKQRVLLVTQSASLLLALALAILTFADRIQLWEIYVLAALLGLVNAFDQPARQSFVTELVGREHAMNAVGLTAAQFSGARLIGPAIAGLVIAQWGVATCFFLNAISFLAVVVSLMFLRSREFHLKPPQRGGEQLLAQLREGVRFLLSTRELTVAIIVLCGNGAFIYSTSTIIPLIAQDELNVGAEQFGLLVAAVGLGSMACALLMASRAKPSQRLLLISGAGFGLCFLSLAFAPSFAVVLVVLTLTGGCIQVFGTSVNILLQLGSPDHLRGRVMAVFTLLTNGIIPLGSLFSGFVTAYAGIRYTLAGEAAICLIAFALALVYRARGSPAHDHGVAIASSASLRR